MFFTSPFGVKTNTSSSKRSVRKLFTNSVVSDSSAWVSMSERTQRVPLVVCALGRAVPVARVRPVRGDAEIGCFVHLAGPHLDLERPALGPITVVWRER